MGLVYLYTFAKKINHPLYQSINLRLGRFQSKTMLLVGGINPILICSMGLRILTYVDHTFKPNLGNYIGASVIFKICASQILSSPEGKNVFKPPPIGVSTRNFLHCAGVSFFPRSLRLTRRPRSKGESWIQMFPVAPLYNYGYTPLR